jgi:glycosyltransferase involved in cell wall biosynthesis
LRNNWLQIRSIKIGKNPIISCGVDLNLYKKASLEYDLGVDVKGRIIVGYCGGLQMWQNINAISDVVRRLYQLDRRIFFVIYTAFDIPDDLNIKLQQLGENNYTVKSLKPSEVPSALKRLDAGFLLRDNLPLNIVSSPTKICEYLAAGVPVICTPYSGDYSRSVQTGRTGYVFIDYPEILESDIERLLCYLIKVKSERDYYSKLCIEAASRRTFDKEYENLTNMIN